MDFSHVIAFEFGSSEGTLDGNFILTSVSTVPEPSSIVALLSGLGVFYYVWRRREAGPRSQPTSA
ncbi:MAG: PEP-CTERM sorting domain-containing protein [Aeoliella sp.]